MTKGWRVGVALALLALAGCGTAYSWRGAVPAEMRRVVVPTFRNESDVPELGAIAARQLAREFQREGTFALAAGEDAALEIQGVIKDARGGTLAYDRRSGLRLSAHEMMAVAEVSVIDRRRGKVLVDNRIYQANATFTAGQDETTAKRDASGRVLEDLARQIVDDVLNLKW